MTGTAIMGETVKVGTIRYRYTPDSGIPGVGTVSSYMYGYVDDDADQPSWYWRWNCTDPHHVHYILDRYPELEREGEVVI